MFWNIMVLQEIEKKWNIREFIVLCNNCWKTCKKYLNSIMYPKWNWCSCWRRKKRICKRKIQKTINKVSNKLKTIFNWIKQRCCSLNNKWYQEYWWRWIKCEWNSFEDFYNDMGSTYKEWLSIDRIDNNWNYCKENCRWTNIFVQNNNRRNVKKLSNWLSISENLRNDWYNESIIKYGSALFSKWISYEEIKIRILNKRINKKQYANI